MNNLLFTALIIALLYYFFYYLPQQQQITNPPLTHSLFTQTEPTPRDNQELEELKIKNQELIQERKDYQNKIREKESQITQLQTQIRDLVKRPLKPTNSKTTQTDDQALEKTLDHLIKDIQDLNNEL